MSFGFAVALFALGSVREVLGSGSFFGVPLFGPDFEPWVIMILPPGGFLMLGSILLLFNATNRRQARKQREREAAASHAAAPAPKVTA
jgi:electron transport complex protein RnfE